MKPDEQLQRWVDGDPVHNDNHPAGIEGGECCPDFSCCKPDLLAPPEVRQAFQRACEEGDEKTVNRMLAGFLGALIKGEGHLVVTSADVVAEARGAGFLGAEEDPS